LEGKLQSVARAVQRYPTLCSVHPTTLRRVTQIWDQFGNSWERLRWARVRAGFERGKDAAISLNIKPGTYRTYEVGKADGGRAPSLSEMQRIARKFKVSWIWVLTGEGSPDEGVVTNERLAEAQTKADAIPEEKRDDAWSAVMGVLDAYARKAG
jgi:hypothetical protein